MVFGGSEVSAVLPAVKGTRPMNQFGVFCFPAIGKPPARVIGRADVVVMLRDSRAARALVQYLATPTAATIWAKRGAFLSPNRKVALNAYPSDTSRSLARALTQASAFRLDLSEQQPASFRTQLGRLLQRFIGNPSSLDQITKELEAAYVATYKPAAEAR
jgi:alpha-glucoside transport system substrate-binding protein